LKFDDVFLDLKHIKENGSKVILMHIDDNKYISKLNNNEFFIANPIN